LPTAAAPVLASWFYQSIPLFSLGDDLQYTCYGFGARPGGGAEHYAPINAMPHYNRYGLKVGDGRG